MNLYIQIENGQPVNHPAIEENLIQVHGSIPENYAPFNRIQLHDANLELGVYQNAAHSYSLSSDGVAWQDTWTAVDMTQEEKDAKNAFLLRKSYNYLDSVKENTQKAIDGLIDENQIEVLTRYLSLLNAVTFTDPSNCVVPRGPKKDSNGNWIANVDENNNWLTKTLPV
jgi:hypothetical protein